jgi:adenosylcobinamide kinase/adenosylcobinamide-phosphate guanylyltransferase
MESTMHHLIVGGQRSGKSSHAQALALDWLRAGQGASVTVIATARAADEEMRTRIERHRADRPAGFRTLEEPLDLAGALRREAAPRRLLLVDCLTLWLANWLMPSDGPADHEGWQRQLQSLGEALPGLASRVLFVSNEVGWGVSPLGEETRRFVDELGRLNQAVAARCAHLTLMVAGQAWTRRVEAREGGVA